MLEGPLASGQVLQLFTYCLLQFYYFFTKHQKTNHLDVPFRTVPEVPWVPRGPFSEGLRKFEEVGESWRELEQVKKVGGSSRKLDKVGEN